jgi:acetyl-CoA/propionyl-CoA carboxylase biotin carboxyl carrier protein
MMFETVLIANRGEIARRVIRTLDRLGIEAVAVHTPADRYSPHVREAGRSVAIDSYLDIEQIIEACVRVGAQALHPGYGFLSESPELARACARAGVSFVGPPPEASELMGDKVRAKQTARAAGVPVLPSFTVQEARGATYPLLVKAAAGGGGRGMREVAGPEDLDGALESARREAGAGFGDDRVFIERFLPRARHLEVQVIADQHGNVVHLGERECSLQRRHQKLIEESPSPVVSAELREQLGREAVAVARAGGYVNAGTVEFIADADDPGEHYFLECNARLQVEHPVTELVCRLDLVALQLEIAAGEELGLAQQDVGLRGHAIEARINAEDAARAFLPAAGRVIAYRRAAQVRVDDGIELGSTISTDYDSLVAKVIAYGQDRDTALARLDRALAETVVLGVTTTTGFLRSLLATEEVRTGRLDTGLIERLPAPDPILSDPEVARAAALMILAGRDQRRSDDPFARLDGWRSGGRRTGSWWRLAVAGGEPVEVVLSGEELAAITSTGPDAITSTGPDSYTIATAGERRPWVCAHAGGVIWVGCEGHAWPVRTVSAVAAHGAASDGDLRAPMPGQVLVISAQVGDRVRAGDPVVVLESMKMELVMSAPLDGSITELSVAVGDRVSVDQPLARVEAPR